MKLVSSIGVTCDRIIQQGWIKFVGLPQLNDENSRHHTGFDLLFSHKLRADQYILKIYTLFIFIVISWVRQEKESKRFLGSVYSINVYKINPAESLYNFDMQIVLKVI